MPTSFRLSVPGLPYLNVLQQLLLAPADVLQLLLLLRGEVLRHWQNTRRESEQHGLRRLKSDATVEHVFLPEARPGASHTEPDTQVAS